MTQNISEFFYSLTPDEVLKSIEAAGYEPTGEYVQLNSYENRVYDIYLEKRANEPGPGHVIAKFYRPLRWSKETLLEEHAFLQELEADGQKVVAPLKLKSGQTLLSTSHNVFYSLFPKASGRLVQELTFDELEKLGKSLAHMHNVGARKLNKFRPNLNLETFAYPALENLENWVAPEVWHRYKAAAEDIVRFLEEHLDESEFIRIHSDCHKGNILKTDFRDQPSEYFFVDFDDCVNGPIIQDFWMLLPGNEDETEEELNALIAGYEEFREFPDHQKKLMRPLRGLRILHYAYWIARRWQDPTFPQLFPQYQSYNYWAEETDSLEKIARSL